MPLLTVLFLISYGLMTMLIVEQGRTIDSQRALIRELFRDSTELSAVKQKAAQDSAQASSAKTQAPVTQNPSSQYPSPSTRQPRHQPVRPRLPRQDHNSNVRRASPANRSQISKCRRSRRPIWWTMSGP